MLWVGSRGERRLRDGACTSPRGQAATGRMHFFFRSVIVRAEPALREGVLPVTSDFHYFNNSAENPVLVSTWPNLCLVSH